MRRATLPRRCETWLVRSPPIVFHALALFHIGGRATAGGGRGFPAGWHPADALRLRVHASCIQAAWSRRLASATSAVVGPVEARQPAGDIITFRNLTKPRHDPLRIACRRMSTRTPARRFTFETKGDANDTDRTRSAWTRTHCSGKVAYRRLASAFWWSSPSAPKARS